MAKEFITSTDEIMEQVARLASDFDSFTLYENGKLVISTTKDAHIVMQFDTRQVAEDWLVEHFDRFRCVTEIVQ